MKVKKLFALIVSFLILFLVFPFILIPVSAREYAVQIIDEKDTNNDADLKSISMKDDFDFLYFSLESWNNWNLASSNCFIMIRFNLKEDHLMENCQYYFQVFENATGYRGEIFDKEKKESTPVSVIFENNNSIGTVKIDKKLINMKSSHFTFQFYTIDLVKTGYYYDAAPDNQSLAKYIPGASTEKPKLDVSTTSVQAGEIKKSDIAKVKFEVMNKGDKSVEVDLTSSSNLILDERNIKLEGYETREIIITIKANKLTSDSYIEPIEVKSNFGSFTIKVSFLILPEPVLVINPEIIEFGSVIKGENKSLKITISNKEKGPIKVSIYTSNRWIVLHTTSFESQTEEVNISLTTKIMNIGLNEGTIKVFSNGGSALIPVSAVIESPVSINISEFNFGDIIVENPTKVDPLPFFLKNQTNQPITLKISISEPWIIVDPEITIKGGETLTSNVSINLDNMVTINKSYYGTIIFESKYVKLEMPVKAYLKKPSPKILWITDPPGQKTIEEKLISGKSWEKNITIKNNGNDFLYVTATWEITISAFKLINDKFSLEKGEIQVIKIKFDSSGLKPGIYKNTLLIKSNDDNISIPITIEVISQQEAVIWLYIGSPFAYINEKQFKLDASPYLDHGATMVPLRFISEVFKAKIEWQPIGKGRIQITLFGKIIRLDIGVPYAFINNEKLLLQASPDIKSGRTFVPVRFIAEAFGATVNWDSKERKITITMKES